MKIFLTGATGFIGAHTALALLDAKHDLRLLVRNEAMVKAYFSQHGHLLDDIVVADMSDKETVISAMQGCDAVFHAAAMVSLDSKKASEIYTNNVNGVDSVIGSAYELDIKNIVYVSSLGALFKPNASVINEHSDLGISKDAYSKSKCDSDAYVRDLQVRGAPIQITYPCGVFGPDDPKLSEANHALTTFLKVMLPITTSGIQCIDVRDVAMVHRHLLEKPPQGDFQMARFILGGNFYSWPEFHRLLESVTGKKLFSLKIPGNIFRIMGAIMDVIKRIYPINFPMTSEAMTIVTQWTVADSSKILNELAMQFRTGEETFTETIQWLVQSGHLEQKHAGKAVDWPLKQANSIQP